MEHPEHVAEVTSFFESAGYKVCIVDSFAKAKAILQMRSFDLIISDVHLENGGSVFDFLKWVRSTKRLQETPFVLFSIDPSAIAKYLADAVHTCARQLGANRCISMQTFEPHILSQEIAELLPARADIPVRTKEEK